MITTSYIISRTVKTQSGGGRYCACLHEASIALTTLVPWAAIQLEMNTTITDRWWCKSLGFHALGADRNAVSSWLLSPGYPRAAGNHQLRHEDTCMLMFRSPALLIAGLPGSRSTIKQGGGRSLVVVLGRDRHCRIV